MLVLERYTRCGTGLEQEGVGVPDSGQLQREGADVGVGAQTRRAAGRRPLLAARASAARSQVGAEQETPDREFW